MVREVRGMGMEGESRYSCRLQCAQSSSAVCTTLGMLTPEQARQLKNAGLSAYNHNLDTSREYYPSVITTRTYEDRLETLQAVRDAGIKVCSGGILGLGEKDEDRVGLIWEVGRSVARYSCYVPRLTRSRRLPEHPESFPVNTLVPIPGTPMENNEVSRSYSPARIVLTSLQPVPVHTVIRTIATARIVMPKTIIRLAAGRHTFTETEQAMAFMAGANAIFTGEQMLTTPCSGWDEDKAMLGRWGLRGLRSFEDAEGHKVDDKFVKVEEGGQAVLTAEAKAELQAAEAQ